MKRLLVVMILGIICAVMAGCGATGEKDYDGRYAAGYDVDDGQVYETDIPDYDYEYEYENDYVYDPDTGIYNPDAGYYYGSTERHSILQDPNDYERGNSR